MMRIFLFTISFFAALSAWAQPNLIFVSAPTGEVTNDSLVTLAIAALPPGTPIPDSCAVYHSPTPAGSQLAGHTSRLNALPALAKDSSALTFAFKATDPEKTGGQGAQLTLGIHYLVAACQDGKYVTPELPLKVVTVQAATITSPKSLETSSSPNFSWTAVPGVPAYHLLLSDQALNIDPNKGTVSGASVIWQVITTHTSIPYGTPDPSGNFASVAAPPLSPNVPYNLVILNNYDGRSALATSPKAQGLKLFTIQSSGPVLAPPKNLSPRQGDSLSAAVDSIVKLKWSAARASGGGTPAASANTYKVYVYSLETQDKVDVLIPIWQTEVTDTFAVLDARRTLLSKRYIWKVFALSDNGSGVVGDTTSFIYENDVQLLSLGVNAIGPAGDTTALQDVRIDVQPLDGSADPLPLFTLSSGLAEKTMAVGSYALTLAKSGYLTQKITVTLDDKGPLRLTQFMPAASCKITGHVVDANGLILDNVQVTASGGDKTVTSVTDAQGFFLLGVAPGTQAVSFVKPDYQQPPDTLVTLAAGKSTDLGNVMLVAAQGSLTGTVVNDKGVALAGCNVVVKRSTGAVERTLLTDDKGSFAAFLAPGNYTVTASRTGFATEEKSVQLSEAVSLRFELASGASLLNGRISLLSWVVANAPQSTPLAGAAVELANAARGTLQKTQSDLHGDYSLSADTGAYLLRAYYPGKAIPESIKVKITVPRSTVVQSLSLSGLAAVQGTLTLSPDTVVDPAVASISLLREPALTLFQSATPQRAPVPGGAGRMSFSLDGIPDGTYRVSCGLPGYGLDVEPDVTIKQAVWKTGLDLTLRRSNKTVTFTLTSGGTAAGGTVHLLTPQPLDLPSGTKLSPAPSGTYTLGADDTDATVLPLSRYSFTLPAGGAPDTTIALPLPFSHQPVPLSFRNQEIEMVLNAQARTDSILIVYGYGAPRDTFRVPPTQLFGPLGPRTLHFNPGPQGGLLTYYFVVRSGALTYANDDASRRFHAQVAPSHDLAYLRLTLGDSLRLPANAKSEIDIHAYDASGGKLDTAVDARGTIVWTSGSALGLRLDRRKGRDLFVTAGDAPPGLAKRGATEWDNLTVTVNLDGVEKTLAIRARVVPAQINKLVLTSTLGEASQTSSPAPFGLFASGFDTTVSPPLPMVPDPVLTLVPPEAGMIKEMQVLLDPRFIGPLRILARHVNPDGSIAETELGAYRDSLERGLNVGQTLRRDDTARLFFHDPRFEIRVPDSLLGDQGPAQAVLRMSLHSVSRTFASEVSDVVAGDLYEISNPSGAPFNKQPHLRLGIPAGFRARRNAPKRFDAKKLDWIDLKDSATSETNFFRQPSLAADIQELDGSYYGLLTQSLPLSTGDVEIIPNPFSPLVLAARDGNTQYGARIRFRPESDRSSEVTVSIRIYNMDGEMVRLLVDNKTVAKEWVDFYWDGKTDGGRWARNGRYSAKISLKATGTHEVKYFLKTIVVFQ